MRLKNLLKPQDIDKNTWCYIGGKKVTIVHEVRNLNGEYRRTIQIKLPISKIRTWFRK